MLDPKSTATITVNEQDQDQDQEGDSSEGDTNLPSTTQNVFRDFSSPKQRELRGEAHCFLLDIFADLEPETSPNDEGQSDPFESFVQSLSSCKSLESSCAADQPDVSHANV